ncbi:MAG: bifunctional DNA-formamidopyrimidine glycosylase/DNA-(apurinic or apyrimidinic site) lyase [Pseudomonadota bacterium]
MPELPEVETVCRGLSAAIKGKTITKAVLRRPDMRFPFPEALQPSLQNARVVSVLRRAKYGLIALSNNKTAIFHLGMSGTMRIDADAVQAEAQLGRHDHVFLIFEDGTSVTFNDTRRFGFMDLAESERLHKNRFLKDLGVEPLSNHFHADYLNQALAGKVTPMKAALLDQRIVAGLGNIYVCEALFMAGISPRRQARTVPGKRAERLVPAIKTVLEKSIAAGGSTLRDYAHVNGELGYFQHEFNAYGSAGEACSKPCCSGVIKRIVQSGRSTFYCGKCQH